MWTPFVVEEVMRRSSPTVERVEVAKDWEATVEPFKDVIDPPAPPASVPQVNVPLAQRSFSVDVLHAVKLAPKSDARVRPPVLDALPKVSDVDVREDTVVVAKVEVPRTVRRLLESKLSDIDRFVAEALAKVDCPVTLSEVRSDDPMSAP